VGFTVTLELLVTAVTNGFIHCGRRRAEQ
jgi:hypothetical protein